MSGLFDIEKAFMKRAPAPRVLNRLLLERSGHAMSQAELARNSGVARQTINAIEQAGQIPSLLTALKIAEVLCAPVDEIFYLHKPKR